MRLPCLLFTSIPLCFFVVCEHNSYINVSSTGEPCSMETDSPNSVQDMVNSSRCHQCGKLEESLYYHFYNVCNDTSCIGDGTCEHGFIYASNSRCVPCCRSRVLVAICHGLDSCSGLLSGVVIGKDVTQKGADTDSKWTWLKMVNIRVPYKYIPALAKKEFKESAKYINYSEKLLSLMSRDRSFEGLLCDLKSVVVSLLIIAAAVFFFSPCKKTTERQTVEIPSRHEDFDQLTKQKYTTRFEKNNSEDGNFDERWKFIFEFQPRRIELTLTVCPFTLNDYANDIVQHNREPQELMKYEWSRYLSFNNFPSESNATPLRLAQAGFFSTNQGEEVECFCCGVRNAHWPEGESVWNVHRRLSPECRFIRGESTANVAIHGAEYYASMDHSM